MRYTVKRCVVQVIGQIWQPGGGVCAYEYTLSPSEVKNLGEWTRENVKDWLGCHAGDFSSIEDFRADFSAGDKDWVSEWADPDSEGVYWDCVDPMPEEDYVDAS